MKTFTKTQILNHNVSRVYRYIKRTAKRLGYRLTPGDESQCAVGTIARGGGEVFNSRDIANLKAIGRKMHLSANKLVQLENGFEGRAPSENAFRSYAEKNPDGEKFEDFGSMTPDIAEVQPRSAYYQLGLRLREEVLNAR